MAKVQTPRDAWVDAALEALAAGGPEAVRVEALAKKLGVSKGGFYWHFKDRGALLEQMLDSWEQTMVEDVIQRVESRPADPRTKLRRLFALAPSANFRVELALRDWSRRNRDVAHRLRRVDRRRTEWLQSLFGQFCTADDAAARSLLAYSLLIGSYFVSSAQVNRSRSEVLNLAVQRLLDDRWD